jgi:sugar-specific transcriptional regulator TrmB
MALQDVFEKIGLTGNETKVYMTMFSIGSSTASEIAKEANLHRRPTYDALARLAKRGLIIYSISGGKRFFQVVNPEKLLEVVKEQEAEVRSILPELNEKYKAKKTKFFAEVYEGNEGLKTIMEDLLREKEDWLTIGATGFHPKSFDYYLDVFANRRERARIKRKVLIADTKEGKAYYGSLEKQKMVEVKFLPKSIQNPQTIWVYGNKTMIMLTSEEHPLMFLIESKEIANSYRDYFNLMWRQVKKV